VQRNLQRAASLRRLNNNNRTSGSVKAEPEARIMKKPVECIFRGSIELTEFPRTLEQTDNHVWISKTQHGPVSGLLGVSTSLIDVVVCDHFFDEDPRTSQVVELSHKTGKFDGNVRFRLLLRRYPIKQAEGLRAVTLEISPDAEVPCTVRLRDRYVDQEPVWEQAFIRYSRRVKDIEHSGDILVWHWQRYYRFLCWVDVQDLVTDFSERVLGLTLSEGNRLASRTLYSRARELGWHKLTLLEQAKLDLSGQWHRDDELVAAKARILGTPNGASDATNRASRPGGRFDPKWDRITESEGRGG